MKTFKKILLSLFLFLIVLVGIGYYVLMRPHENIEAPRINFNSLEASSKDKYPIFVKNIDSILPTTVVKKDVKIILSDGIKLSANVFKPQAKSKYPVVLSFTAYDKDKGPDQYPPPLKAAYLPNHKFETIKVSPWTMWEAPDPAFWVSHGYAVVQVDSRGYFSSEGNASLFDEQNIKDFHEVIKWAGTQAWSNGNVGLNGVSYLAIAQWFAATNNPPKYLKAIIPWEGNTDAFREVLYHGGIPETMFTRFWVNRIRNCANKAKPLPPFPVFQLGHKNPWLLKKIQKAPKLNLNEITVPALICGTWSDQGLHSRGEFEGYKKIASKHKWLFTHGREKWSTYYSPEALAFQKRFFNYFLKGLENGMDTIPSVRLEVRESLDRFKVRYENSWPIPNTQYQELYLNATTKQLNTNLVSDKQHLTYKPMEEQAAFRYQFAEDTELSGNMKLKLWVSTSKGSDMDLFVAVKKYDIKGVEETFYAKAGYTKGPVAMGWLRVSERELDAEKSTPWQPILTHNNPQKIKADDIVPVEIEILPSSTFFKKGEFLEVVIQGKDFFKHPSLGHHYSVNKGNHSIYTGNNYDSHLLIPIIPNKKAN